MKVAVRKLARFLGDERGSMTLEYALVSAITGLTSVGIGTQLHEAQAQANEAFVLAFDEALEDALLP